LDADAVLRRRAAQLATIPKASDSGDVVEVLVLRLGDERYAVETRHLSAFKWATGVTPVPCTPSFVVGIVSVRGEIVTLLDLGVMIGLAPAYSANDSSCPVLLVGLPGLRCGLVVNEVVGVQTLDRGSLQPSLSGREFARGVGPLDTVLLDLEALFGSGRFDVCDEP
jgi:purine-binding chemotaxis protein CheW